MHYDARLRTDPACRYVASFIEAAWLRAMHMLSQSRA